MYCNEGSDDGWHDAPLSERAGRGKVRGRAETWHSRANSSGAPSWVASCPGKGLQGENHRDNGSRCQGCSGDANRSVGMVGNRAVRDRRQSSSPNDASVEQREGSAELRLSPPVPERSRRLPTTCRSRTIPRNGRRTSAGWSGNIDVDTMNRAVTPPWRSRSEPRRGVGRANRSMPCPRRLLQKAGRGRYRGWLHCRP